MKSITIVPVCPIIGKPCIKDGITSDVLMNRSIIHPCELWDQNTYNGGISPDEPCRFKRAINRILSDEIPDTVSDDPPEVPF